MTKHLEFIQNTITRIGHNSFLIKGWTITFISLLFILSIGQSNESFLLLALLPLCCFWILDAYYLRQERLFRNLYDDVREGKIKEPFIMNTAKCIKNEKIKGVFFTMFSPTIALIYITIILLNIILQLLVINGLI